MQGRHVPLLSLALPLTAGMPGQTSWPFFGAPAFAAVDANGRIRTWSPEVGRSTAPNGSSFTDVFSTYSAFAALDSRGRIHAWGSPEFGGSGAPTAMGFRKIYSTYYAFAALNESGHIQAWGSSSFGGSGAPAAATGFLKVSSTYSAFAALDESGRIYTWGSHSSGGGADAPQGTGFGFTDVSSTHRAFAALDALGAIHAWGDAASGGDYAPRFAGFTKLYSSFNAFAAIDASGRIYAWGNPTDGGKGAPTGMGFTKVLSTNHAFAALDASGRVYAWGNPAFGGSGAPNSTRVVKVYSTYHAFAALDSSGRVYAWGHPSFGGSGAPTGTGFTHVYSTCSAFAALDASGRIHAWGDPSFGGSGAPHGDGYTALSATDLTFRAARDSSGRIYEWGASSVGKRDLHWSPLVAGSTLPVSPPPTPLHPPPKPPPAPDTLSESALPAIVYGVLAALILALVVVCCLAGFNIRRLRSSTDNLQRSRDRATMDLQLLAHQVAPVAVGGGTEWRWGAPDEWRWGAPDRPDAASTPARGVGRSPPSISPPSSIPPGPPSSSGGSSSRRGHHRRGSAGSNASSTSSTVSVVSESQAGYSTAYSTAQLEQMVVATSAAMNEPSWESARVNLGQSLEANVPAADAERFLDLTKQLYLLFRIHWSLEPGRSLAKLREITDGMRKECRLPDSIGMTIRCMFEYTVLPLGALQHVIKSKFVMQGSEVSLLLDRYRWEEDARRERTAQLLRACLRAVAEFRKDADASDRCDSLSDAERAMSRSSERLTESLQRAKHKLGTPDWLRGGFGKAVEDVLEKCECVARERAAQRSNGINARLAAFEPVQQQGAASSPATNFEVCDVAEAALLPPTAPGATPGATPAPTPAVTPSPIPAEVVALRRADCSAVEGQDGALNEARVLEMNGAASVGGPPMVARAPMQTATAHILQTAVPHAAIESVLPPSACFEGLACPLPLPPRHVSKVLDRTSTQRIQP